MMSGSKPTVSEYVDNIDPLADLFGFEAAQRRLEESQKEPYVEPSFIPWRVFVNQIDSYHGKKLADFLPEKVYVDQSGGGDEGLGEEEEGGEGEGGDGGEGVGEGEEEKTEPMKSAEPPKKYEVVGTVMDSEYHLPEDVTMIIKHERDRESFLTELMRCGVIIYDITQDKCQIAEAQWALEAVATELEKMVEETPKAFKRSDEVRHFILISTVMTWALTKPLDPEDPDLPFTEADYRKRKPHPNFKDHVQCEKDYVIMKKHTGIKDKLKTVVLCCGVTYGDEEGPLHYLFKMGWHNEPELPIFGKGHNKVPLLHVRDLVTIVYMFLREWPSLRYVVAVEQVLTSQKTIVKRISRVLTTGKVKNIAMEEAFLLGDITQQSYDMMTVNLRIEPAYIVEQNIEWHSELPYDENIDAILKEYKTARNLRPVKLIVLGPPASGKTRLALSLSKHYRIHYIYVKTLITDTIQKLTNDIEAAKEAEAVAEEEAAEDEGGGGDEGDDEDEAEEDEEEAAGIEEWQEELDEIRNNLAENNGRLDDSLLKKIFMKRLMSKECQNQGYVIDGYPKTLSQAKELFGVGEDEEEELGGEEEEVEGATPGGNNRIMPEMVIALGASDDFLKERVLCLPEREIQRTHYTEEHMLRRLQEYRDRNTDDNTPLQFFDELEVHPFFIDVEDDPCPDMFPSMQECLKKIGKPRNYGPTPDELRELNRRADAEARSAEAAERERQRQEDLERKEARETKMMEWTNLLERLKQEEEEQLCILGEPLRHYLVKYVFPTLTQGLIEVAKLRPDDPVDYLAEYLFKENPEGKMFEPDFTETMSMLLAAVEELQNDILPRDELDKGVEKYIKATDRTTQNVADDEEVAGEIEGPDRGTCSTSKQTYGQEGLDEIDCTYDVHDDAGPSPPI